MQKREHSAAGAVMAVCLVMMMSAACGGKYEPIVLESGTDQAAAQATEQAERAGSSEQRNGSRIQIETTADDGLNQENTGSGSSIENPGGTAESVAGSEESSSETAAESSASEGAGDAESGSALAGDFFYNQCGMTRDEAETYRIGLIEDVMSENREAVATRFRYPKTVTVSSGSYEVQSADEFLAYYDEIFSETFRQNMDAEAEEELFCNDGMISFGSGLVWFGPVYGEDAVALYAVNGANECSVRDGGM